MNEKDLFFEALETAGPERAGFLDRVCAGDPEKRKRLEQLLASHSQPDHFMEAPAVEELRVIAENSGGLAGTSIGRYKLLELIGEGGFGSVYLAEQGAPVRRKVALKIIKLGMDTRQVVARFAAEQQALAVMEHPNIAKVLDAGATESGRPFFVMELVLGERITDFCARNELSVPGRLKLFLQVCDAIQHAHQKGLIHRDIKPSNIVVTQLGGAPAPKVIDFGIAKAIEGDLTDKTLNTQYHQFIGTPAYMSPEQAEMSGLNVDTRTDIYALGVLLYELLTGHTPFESKELLQSGLEQMRKTIREKEPVRPSTRLRQTAASVNSSVTARSSPLASDLDWIVMKCLEKDRTRRYATANGLAADIQRHLSNEPVAACPPSKVYEFQKLVRRHKAGFMAAAAVFMALVLGVALTTWQAVRATHAQREAVAARQAETAQRVAAEIAEGEARSQRDLAREHLLDSLLRELRSITTVRPLGFRSQLQDRVRQALELSPSAERREALRSEFTRGLGDPLGLSPVQVEWDPPLGEQDRVYLRLSRDGRLVATWSTAHGLTLRETAGATTVARLELPGASPINLAFSPDSRRLFGVIPSTTEGQMQESPQAAMAEWRQANDQRWTLHSTIPVRDPALLLTSRDGVFLIQATAGNTAELEVVNTRTMERTGFLRLREGPAGGKMVPDPRITSIAPRRGWITGRLEKSRARQDAAPESVAVWNLKTSECERRLEPLPGIGAYYAARFSPDERYLVCSAANGLVVYETHGFSVVARAYSYFGDTGGAVFVKDGSWIAMADPLRSGIRLVSIATGESTHLPGMLGFVQLEASDDGSMLGLTGDRWQALVPLRDTAERIRFSEHTVGATAAEFASSGRLLATTGKDGAIRFWDPAGGRLVREIVRTNAVRQTLAFSPDERWLAVGDYEHSQIEIFPVEGEGECVVLGERLPGRIWGCGFSPDGRWLVAIGLGSAGSLRIWERVPENSGRLRWEPRLAESFSGEFRNLVFEPRGAWFAYAGTKTNGPWSIFVRRLRPPFESVSSAIHTSSSAIQSLGFVPGANQLALGSPDGYSLKPGTPRPLRFIDPQILTIVRSVPLLAEGEETSFTGNISISPDGSRAAAAAHDGRRVNIYEVASGRRLYSLGEDPGVVWWLAWHPDGRRLVVTRDTGDVSIWRLAEVEAALAAAHLAVGN